MATDAQRQAAVDALEAWNRGDQQGAVDRVRPLADEDAVIGLGLISWFLYQMGEPRWREGVPYAIRAARAGLPWVVNYYSGNMLNDPSLRSQVPELMQLAVGAGWPIDPVAQAMTPFQQGDRATALSLLEIAGPWPRPEEWHQFIERVRQQATVVEELATAANVQRDETLRRFGELVTEVESTRDRVATQANQVLKLIETTTSAEVQSFFDEEATRNTGEARALWIGGLAVLSIAAVLSVLPLLGHYLNFGPTELTKGSAAAVTLTPALALGAVSGVLLSRSKGRDRAGQRARDLSVALGTMFVYSGQIADENERQRFLHEMGRVVIEAFLRQDAPSGEDVTSVLSTFFQRRT